MDLPLPLEKGQPEDPQLEQAEDQDEDSILNYYRKLTALRKQYPVIQDGTIEFLYRDQEEIFAYRRTWNGQELIVLNNFFGKEAVLSEELPCEGYRILIGNYRKGKDPSEGVETPIRVLRPYECIALFKEAIPGA